MALSADFNSSTTRKKFYESLRTEISRESYVMMSEKKYHEIINEVEEAMVKQTKTSKDYRRLKRFNVLHTKGMKRLIVPPSTRCPDTLYFAFEEELYEILEDAHLYTGHGGRNRMDEHLKRKYKNISRSVIMLYLNLCEACQKKKNQSRKGLVVNDLNVRGQVDLIDMQTHQDQDYKFIMVYQDFISKFVCLRPLRSNTAMEIAAELMDIFCVFGAPSVLQSDNGREFVKSVIEELKKMWDGLIIVQGKECASSNKESIEKTNGDLKNMIFTWMEERNSKRWSQELKFCQFRKNNSFHGGIQQTPFEILFGHKAHIGLNCSNLPRDVVNNLVTEEDLEEMLSSIKEENEVSPSDTPFASEEDASMYEMSINEPEIEIHTLGENSDIKSEKVQLCCICGSVCFEDIMCIKCKKPVHDFCGKEVNDCDIMCQTCDNAKNQLKTKQKVRDGFEKQAKKIKFCTEETLPPLPVGTVVTIPIPNSDRRKVDVHMVLGVVLDVTDDGNYKLGTSRGIINSFFLRNQILKHEESSLEISNVPNVDISLGEVIKKEFGTEGKCYTSCSCKLKCVTNKCKCRANNLKCNYKCHPSLACTNND